MADSAEESANAVKTDPADLELTPESSAETNDMVEYLKQAIHNLPHDLKATLILYQYEGLSYKEIAEIVGCSPKGVETRLYRTRKQLKRVLLPKFSETNRIAATREQATG